MEIGICCEFYEKWGEERYKKIKGHGYSYVDFGMANTEAPIYLCDNQEFEARLLYEKKLMNEAQIKISQVHGPWRWPAKDATKEEQEERMDKMKKSIYGTALLGCKNWVVHPIMPYGVQEKDTKYAEQTWHMNYIFMSELLKTAKQYGVTICLENMPLTSFSLGSPSEVLKFVKTMDDENLKICLDTGHAAVYKETTPANAVRELGKEIRVLHIHDNNGIDDLHLLPYFGVIDWQDFGRALKEVEFQGVFSYEAFLPGKLPTPIFEEMSRLLVRLGREIIL